MTLAVPTLWLLSWTALYGISVLVSLAGTLIWHGRWQQRIVDMSLLMTLLGSIFGALGACAALINPTGWNETTPVWTLLKDARPYLPDITLEIRVDSLSAAFALLITGFAVIVTVYSFGALRAKYYQRQRTWIAGAFSAFTWATLLVVVVNDLFSLTVALEVMTLAFGGLALYKQDLYQTVGQHTPSLEQSKDALLAPQIYLIISHASTAFLLVAFLFMTRHANGMSFDDLRLTAATYSSAGATLIFLILLAGLGIRAGLVPAHFWVSLVHPSSPTTTHAFSLGIAIKIAVYLMIRFFFQFLQPQSLWGYLLLGVAAITAVVNVWYAIASHDLKKALAYHSIENVGIIMVGVGAALLFQSIDLSALAILALTAGLYHLLNHAVFKGLLYLGTGTIEFQTDQIVDIERLGGLLKIWPLTAGAFLVGAVSIAGFPPFNGFVSEWLTLQSLLNGLYHEVPGLAGKLMLVLTFALLVVSFALTAFCFVKIAGMALLGRPRSNLTIVEGWRRTPPPPWTMRSMMVLLAAMCLLLGLFPVGVMQFLVRVSGGALGYGRSTMIIDLPVLDFLLGDTFVFESQTTLLAISIVACFLGFGVWVLRRVRLRGHPRVMESKTPWNCGTPYNSFQTQYTGAALSFLIRDLFGTGWGFVSRSLPKDYLPANMVMSEGASGGTPRTSQIVLEVFRVGYNRLISWLLLVSARIEAFFQNGDIRRYLAYILIVNLIVLLFYLLYSG